MRILQIVTLLTPDGAYGGPTRVATNQSSALRERGHAVHVAAAYRGFASAPQVLGGAPVAAFRAVRVIPRAGFAGLASPGLHKWLRKNLSSYDVVHVHLARDLVTLPAAHLALRRRVPLVAQTHGMIDPSSHPLARPLDYVCTQEILRRAAVVLHLTAREAADLKMVAGDSLNLAELGNGVPLPNEASSPNGGGVLFLARLQDRKRPLAFVEMAKRLAPHHADRIFRLVGPDEGQGAAVNRAISDSSLAPRITWTGPCAPDQVSREFRDSAVYVLPSYNEPYPMSVLEAMALGRPVVITESCGLADQVRAFNAGLVVDHSIESLTEAVDFLLTNDDAREQFGHNARRAAEVAFSMTSVSERLEAIYTEAYNQRELQ